MEKPESSWGTTGEQLPRTRQSSSEKEHLVRRKLLIPSFIANFKPRAYWFCPQFLSPGRIFKDLIPRLFDMYRQFSGSTHGSFIGSVLFSDSPDAPSIDPQENPARTRNAIVASSRLLLDISFARGQFDGIADLAEYKEIVKTYILPQKDK